MKDFEAPHRLGMKSIWYKNEDGLYFENGDTYLEYINDLAEVLNCIDCRGAFE